ncbi:MAG TPA: hypothetical protein VFF73_40175, partial [Planctomycetota bacterium]|nr:hypothetical protein [Planctomycetota bacterium]
MRKRPDSALWSALEAAELEEAEIGALAVARGIVDARGLAAMKRRGVARALEERLGSAAALALRDEARRAVARCPSCGIAFVRVSRPDDAPCVHCGKGPADTTEQPIEVPSSSTPMIIMDDSSAEPGAEAKPKPRLPALPEGARVADYAIDREIGRGGMGVVY